MKLNDKEALKAFLLLHDNIQTSTEAKSVISTLLADKSNWKLAEDYIDYFLDCIYATLGMCYMILNQWDDAIDSIKEGIKAANKRWPEFGYENKYRLYFNLHVCYGNKLDRKNCLAAFRNAIYNEIKLNSHTCYPKFDFYTFRNTKSFAIADLEENKISFSSLFDFNDPVDSAYFSCIDHYIAEVTKPAEKLILEVRREAYSNLRAKCFITSKPLPNHTNYRPTSIDIPPYLNTLMWSHYASYHNGYCAMYNFPMEVTQVKDAKRYVLKVDEIKYVEELKYPDSIDFNTAFYTKSKRWEYEHEKRICYYTLDDTPSHPEVTLPMGCLKEVYIGLRCDNEYGIYKALLDKPDVKVFKMQVSNQDIYSLEAIEIDRSTWSPDKNRINAEGTNDCPIKRVLSCIKKSISNDCVGLSKKI